MKLSVVLVKRLAHSLKFKRSWDGFVLQYGKTWKVKVGYPLISVAQTMMMMLHKLTRLLKEKIPISKEFA